MSRIKRQSKREQQLRAEQQARRWAAIKKLSSGLFAIALALGAFFSIGLLLDQPVQDIKIEASWKRVQAHDVQNALDDFKAEYPKHGFLSLSLPDLQLALENIQWVDRARIKRLWPNRLQISLTEQIPAARWREQGLLNVRGELFATKARHVPSELPSLAGPDGSEWQVAQRYLELQEKLRNQGVSVRALRLDAKGAWRTQLVHANADFEVRLGCCELDKRTERLLNTVLPEILNSSKRVAYVDLRYSNGFAVKYLAEVGAATRSASQFVLRDIKLISLVMSLAKPIEKSKMKEETLMSGALMSEGMHHA